jgi:acyl-CoA reductase-like NAD-dependent aldehyde dehydrogenase
MPQEERASSASDWQPVRVKMLIDGKWHDGEKQYETIDPYRGGVASIAPATNAAELDRALDAATRAKAKAAAMPGYQRAAILRKVCELLPSRTEAIAQCMTRETGKAIKDSRLEVARSAETLMLSAEEAVRIEGEHVPLDASPMGAGKIAVLLRFPIGVVAAITPFNAPFNLACHKVGPAIAAGNTVVLKGSPQAPGVVHLLAELFADAGLPPGFLNTVYGHDAGPALVRDPRVGFITFTGSTRAGTHIRANAGLRPVALELGGIGPTIVHDDAPVAEAARLCGRNSMRLAGQSCISVQNIFVHEAVRDEFAEVMLGEVNSLKLGDPLDEATDVGTLIDKAAADRVATTITEALDHGAVALAGGRRVGNAGYAPTVLEKVDQSMRIVNEEIFGPAASIRTYRDVDPVFQEISDSPLGLQGGIFTRSLELGIKAAKTMRVGGVIINGTSTWRTDQLPYGGVKDSGLGREGPRYAIRDMTEQRLVVFNL